MNKRFKLNTISKLLALAISSLMVGNANADDEQITAKAVAESRFFLQDGMHAGQPDEQFSFSFEFEWYKSWNDGNDAFTFKPFVRIDSEDEERQHWDIRELVWLHVGEDWELRTGVSKVYWGVTESQHLVDVINQTDTVESVDGEQKLGQQMVHLSLIRDWGTIDAFVLPGFREANFNGPNGRFRTPLPIKDSETEYESSSGKEHVDFALRWSHTLGDWDVGLSYFDGTDRQAGLKPMASTDPNQSPYFVPYYRQMQQVGVDVQATIEEWLWKFEAIHRKGKHSDFTAITGGFEYTYTGVFDTVWDLGVLMEYQYDTRDDASGGDPIVPGQNDIFTGARIAFNDEDGTELLAGFVQDLDESGSRSALIEASSRINDNWKWRLDAWYFASDNPSEVSYTIAKDDFIQFSLEYYY